MKTFIEFMHSARQSPAQKAELSRQIAEDSAGVPVTVVPFGATGIPMHEPRAKKYSESAKDTGFLGAGLNASRAAAKRGARGATKC